MHKAMKADKKCLALDTTVVRDAGPYTVQESRNEKQQHNAELPTLSS